MTGKRLCSRILASSGPASLTKTSVRRDRKDVDIYVEAGQQQVVASWGISFEWFGRDYHLRIASGK